MKHTSRVKALTFLLFCSLAFASTAVADQWIHVRVESPDDDELVTVNLPFSLLNAAVAMIPEEVKAEGHMVLDDVDLDWQQMMNLWDEIRNSPEATFVTVETKDENIAVRKEGEFLVVKTTEHSDKGAQVDVQLPLAVVDALLSGPEGTFDFEAALRALADFGPGNLVSVRDEGSTVRVWIDDQNEAD